MFYAYKLQKLAVPKSLGKLKQVWQSGSANFPDTTENEVDTYCKDAPKAILKGKSLESSGNVFDVECRTISPNLKYCFVRGSGPRSP